MAPPREHPNAASCARVAVTWIALLTAVVLLGAFGMVDLRVDYSAGGGGGGGALRYAPRSSTGLLGTRARADALEVAAVAEDPRYSERTFKEKFNGGRLWLPVYEQATSGEIAMPDGAAMRWEVFRDGKPRILRIENMLNEAEAGQLIELARAGLRRSRTVSDTGKGKESSVRTSEGAFLDNHEAVVKTMRKRVSRIAVVPRAHIESTQILRYEAGQEYRMHPDFFGQSKLDKMGHDQQRVATCIVYLNEVGRGGGTKFNSDPETVFMPAKHSAVLFYSVDDEGHLDRHALHAGLPPEGNSIKWVAVFWIRQGPLH